MTSLPIGEWSCPRTTSCWPQARLLSRSPIPTCALRACTIGDTAGTQKKRAILIPPCALCSLHRRDLTRWSACCEGPTGSPRRTWRESCSTTSRRAMTEKLTCGRLSTCELCSRCLLAEMLFQGRTWLPHPSMSWVGGLTTLCDRVQSSREGARARVSPYDW